MSLKARQFLITAHQPSYEMRYNQIESIFLAAANTEDHICQAKYHQLITTSIMMFDVLPCLFYHTNTFVKQAALEVTLLCEFFKFPRTVSARFTVAWNLKRWRPVLGTHSDVFQATTHYLIRTGLVLTLVSDVSIIQLNKIRLLSEPQFHSLPPPGVHEALLHCLHNN